MNAKKENADKKVSAFNTQEGGASSTEPNTAHGSSSARKLPIEFGRYRLLKELGVGGMGTVYLAHDTQLDRQVALKLPNQGNISKVQMERFRREARLSATLDHPNICRVYDFGEHQGRMFLTMAYIKGNSLHDTIRAQGPVPPRVAVNLVRNIATAVEYAHSQGIIHRDLKPANIMLMKNQQFVIMDFGLARRIERDDEQVTIAGAVLGTPAYMSPEQLRGDLQKLGPHSDVYSLGIILYELLVGERAFQGTLPEIYAQVLTSDSIAPAFEIGIDPRLCEICRTATHSEIAKRYASAAQLAMDLSNYLSASGSTDSGKSIVRSVAIAPPREADPLPMRTAFATDYRRKRKSNNTFLIAAMATSSAVLLLALFVLFGKQLVSGASNALASLGKPATAPTVPDAPPPLPNIPSPNDVDPAASSDQLTLNDNSTNIATDNTSNEPQAVEAIEPASPKSSDAPNDSALAQNASPPTPTATPTPTPTDELASNPATPEVASSTPRLAVPKRLLQWSRAMQSAKEAVLYSDFDTFRSQIGVAKSTASSPQQNEKQARLELMGALQERIIKVLRDVKPKDFIVENRTDKGKVKILSVGEDSIKVQDGIGDYTLSWLRLDPKLVRKLVVPVLDSTDPFDLAAWATYLKLTRIESSETNNADAVLNRCVGKGSIPSNYPLAFSDTYEIWNEPSSVDDESYNRFSGKANGDVRDDNVAKIRLAWVPSGEFMIGSPSTEAGRGEYEAQTQVTLTRGFWLGQTEVTQAQWKVLMNTEPWKGATQTGTPDEAVGDLYPAHTVSWNECMDFLDELNEREASRLPVGWVYTLPTEAQWEYACRAGSDKRFCFGDDESQLGAYAWINANSTMDRVKKSREVGQKRANAFGLLDMHGNVEEWCRDSFFTDPAGGLNPLASQAGAIRVVRGGHFANREVQCRSASRHGHRSSAGQSVVGFRVALVPVENAKALETMEVLSSSSAPTSASPVVAQTQPPIEPVLSDRSTVKLNETTQPKLDAVISKLRLTLARKELFSKQTPFKGLNATYVENGALTIKSDSGVWGFNFAKLAENQVLYARVRVSDKDGAVGILFTPDTGPGLGAWIDGRGVVSINASIFASEDAKATMNSARYAGEGLVKPAEQWNEIALLQHRGALSVFVNKVLVSTRPMEGLGTTQHPLAFGIRTASASARRTKAEMDSFEIYKVE